VVARDFSENIIDSLYLSFIADALSVIEYQHIAPSSLMFILIYGHTSFFDIGNQFRKNALRVR